MLKSTRYFHQKTMGVIVSSYTYLVIVDWVFGEAQ